MCVYLYVCVCVCVYGCVCVYALHCTGSHMEVIIGGMERTFGLEGCIIWVSPRDGCHTVFVSGPGITNKNQNNRDMYSCMDYTDNKIL